ncbi:MAG TPA: DUF3500 domain-containing protein [Chitinophagaceae bacterium]|nr:DUF3500 domain-containing protein [Chitinophagaceae bacterium]
MIIKNAVLFIFLAINVQCTAQHLSEKANNFLNTLSPELKSQALFSLTDSERMNMNYVPIERKGPTFHDFNDKQKQAALELLKASLSSQGYQKSTEIMQLENVLYMMENNTTKKPEGKTHRDPLNYHLCIFGKPSPNDFWGWRFEGHHISLNFTSTNGKIVSSTPSFFGSNPGIVSINEQKGKEVLKSEGDLGFKLLNALTQGQLRVAVFSDVAPEDIVTTNKRKVENIETNGIRYSALTGDQKKIFMTLLNVYIDNYELNFANKFRDKIKKGGLENLYFAWSGSLKPGIGHYYRIYGPVLLIEYDNTQNHANHVHTVVRDLTNDYGEDILREHYKTDHHK